MAISKSSENKRRSVRGWKATHSEKWAFALKKENEDRVLFILFLFSLSLYLFPTLLPVCFSFFSPHMLSSMCLRSAYIAIKSSQLAFTPKVVNCAYFYWFRIRTIHINIKCMHAYVLIILLECGYICKSKCCCAHELKEYASHYFIIGRKMFRCNFAYRCHVHIYL